MINSLNYSVLLREEVYGAVRMAYYYGFEYSDITLAVDYNSTLIGKEVFYDKVLWSLFCLAPQTLLRNP